MVLQQLKAIVQRNNPYIVDDQKWHDQKVDEHDSFRALQGKEW